MKRQSAKLFAMSEIDDLFLYKIPKESKFKNHEKSAYEDVLYFGSMLFFKEIALSHYQNREFDSSVLSNSPLFVPRDLFDD